MKSFSISDFNVSFYAMISIVFLKEFFLSFIEKPATEIHIFFTPSPKKTLKLKKKILSNGNLCLTNNVTTARK